MTKERERQRAKANAAKKAKKRATNADKPEEQIRPGRFDPRAHGAKGPGAKGPGGTNKGNTFGPPRRGSARSG
ncbi:MAG: hypothetical protein KAS38_18260 [Anaerolineales bacterium]|nr:hypothetical protein [Anaerolineales bacterium]